MQTSAFPDGNLPVFAFPSLLTFYADDKSTYKQIVTLYNPYEFPLKFQVLSTAPTKYAVCDSRGILRPRCCVEIVVRHNAISPENYGKSDKIRFAVHGCGHGSLSGKQDVVCTLLPARPEPAIQLYQESDFEDMLTPEHPSIPRSRQYQIGVDRGVQNRQNSRPSVVIIMVAIISVIVLMLPLTGDSQSSLPSYLHLTLHPKLVAAYVLGECLFLVLTGL